MSAPKEPISRLIDDLYDDDREESLWTMAREFYNRRMLKTALLIWAFGLVCVALAIISALAFFRADAIKDQIMYATIFLLVTGWLGLIKILAWQIINRNSVKREIKRLELRIAKLGQQTG